MNCLTDNNLRRETVYEHKEEKPKSRIPLTLYIAGGILAINLIIANYNCSGNRGQIEQNKEHISKSIECSFD